MGQIKHPSLYEIPVRVLLRSLGKNARLRDIPPTYWRELRRKGIDWVWLMGIWEIREKAIDPFLIPQGMIQEFRELAPGLQEEDITGSPYAIHAYVVDPDIGDAAQLAALRKTLHRYGMRLMLDFVPNHLGAHCKYLDTHPEYFIEVYPSDYRKDPKTYYRPDPSADRYFAHGKDPYFDAWQDTIQVNYANPAVHEWLKSILLKIAEMCDGVRCDMAMLPVRRIFRETWGSMVPQAESMPEFWPAAIRLVKEHWPGFVFLAECYWNMEGELLEMGFDFCYDKRFYDLLNEANTDRMRQHFLTDSLWLERTARFLENHDELRAAQRLELQRHMVAAAMVAFGPGMRFWHMGQWEGRRKRIPVQIRTLPPEPRCGCPISKPDKEVVCSCISEGYQRLLSLNQTRVFREGEWQVIRDPATPGLMLWLWQLDRSRYLVAMNYHATELPFSLADFFHLLGSDRPVDLLLDQEVDLHDLHALAPWSVHVWKIADKA